MSAKKKWIIVISAIIVIGLIVGGIVYMNSNNNAKEMSVEEAETFLNKAFDDMSTLQKAKITPVIAEKNHIKVNNLTYGDEKSIIVDCSVETIDLYSVVSPHYDRFLGQTSEKQNSSTGKSASVFKIYNDRDILALLEENSPVVTNNCTITIYDTHEGLKVYATDDVLNAVYGGVKQIEKDVKNRTTYFDENGNEQKISSPNAVKGFVECFALRYDSKKPDTANFLGRTWNSFKEDFRINFLEHDRWKTIFKGLWVTLELTFCALIIGIVLGFLVAFVRCTYLKKTKRGIVLKILNGICQFYLTIIRGTPAMVQIMIIYFVIFMPLGVSKFLSAVVCFGINSGAYVAEIVRGGIMSVDEGQTEAGRSLGFGYMQTMYHIIFPQAFKAVLPSLANEFVVLLKETSIAFYIGLGDIMYSVNAIRAATYAPFMPLLAAALIYLILVLVLSKLVSLLERRLRNNER